ncbi:hypothetical protein M4I33_04375 [Clostridium sp. LY3-2]|uniref:hypothetical protein n=1 Tax=Clostridium sp. LY3-2 TaxID=2942482 RepID=UPI00215211D4|nr:hypothetical protein [Clostridium sp. LY3-2]MCR6514114.1 hypothetical protein [Clostridium sp. LY3-2]
MKKFKCLSVMLIITGVFIFTLRENVLGNDSKAKVLRNAEEGVYKFEFKPKSNKEYLYIKIKGENSNLYRSYTLSNTEKSCNLTLNGGDTVKVYAKEYIGRENKGIRVYDNFKEIESKAKVEKIS